MPYQQYTFSDFLTQLATRVDQAPYWTGTDALQAVNEGLRLWNLYTSAWQQRRVVTIIGALLGQPWFTQDALLAHNARVSWNGTPLSLVSMSDLDLAHVGWEGQTTASGGSVPTTPQVWAPAGLNLFGIWPSDATGSGALTIDGVRVTPVLNAGFGWVDLNVDHFDTILGYAQHVLSFKEGGERFAATAGLRQRFLRDARAQNARLRQIRSWMGVLGELKTRGSKPVRAGGADDGSGAASVPAASQAAVDQGGGA